MGKFIDLTGQRFGRLFVVNFEYSNRAGSHWLCRCDCGKEKIIRGNSLRQGTTSSCGCYNKEILSLKLLSNLKGQRFERLLVLDRGPDYISPKGTKIRQWYCLCDCGNTILTRGISLKAGYTTSCGCLRLEVVRGGIYRGNMELRIIKGVDAVYRQCAKKKNGVKGEYLLTLDDVEELYLQQCHYCNKDPSNTTNIRGDFPIIYSGLDRIDSSKGYTRDNVVPCCIECNQAKNDMTVEEFYQWIERVYLKKSNNIVDDFTI